jgi:outer membrane protein OmpA-like peptidoglycan-associated protein
MRKFLFVVPIALLAVGGSTACATKKFVRTSVGEVNSKVDSMGRTVEETQERTRKNEAQISDVDKRAQAGIQATAQEARAGVAQASSAAAAAGAKADALDKASRRLVLEVMLTEGQGDFTTGRATLPDAAKAKINDLISRLKQDPKEVYLEIEGHTDNTGSPELNQQLGLERADAVKRYLYEQYQIPLHKISVISYGQDKPVAPNNTRAGRAQNRRVVIRVLS